jgi:hypothetical protein
MNSEILLAVITILVTVIGYFLKKTFDKVEVIGTDMAEVKAKVDVLWKNSLRPLSK